jgi:L-fucose isomerase-like protein
MVLEKISGKPSFFANVSCVDAQRSSIILHHCVAPLKLLGPDSPQLPYKLDDYHAFGKGYVPRIEIPVGIEVTMGFYKKDLKDFVLWPGRICKWPDDIDHHVFHDYNFGSFCGNRTEIKIKDTVRFLQNIPGIHQIMVAGNYTKEVADVMSPQNVNIIGPIDSNTLS